MKVVEPPATGSDIRRAANRVEVMSQVRPARAHEMDCATSSQWPLFLMADLTCHLSKPSYAHRELWLLLPPPPPTQPIITNTELNRIQPRGPAKNTQSPYTPKTCSDEEWGSGTHNDQKSTLRNNWKHVLHVIGKWPEIYREKLWFDLTSRAFIFHS